MGAGVFRRQVSLAQHRAVGGESSPLQARGFQEPGGQRWRRGEERGCNVHRCDASAFAREFT